jgi:hypothetical protein
LYLRVELCVMVDWGDADSTHARALQDHLTQRGAFGLASLVLRPTGREVTFAGREYLLRYISTTRMSSSTTYDGPYAAELALAFEIASEAGRMITTASSKRWAQTSNEGTGNEPGTKKNSVDVSYCPSFLTGVCLR